MTASVSVCEGSRTAAESEWAAEYECCTMTRSCVSKLACPARLAPTPYLWFGLRICRGSLHLQTFSQKARAQDSDAHFDSICQRQLNEHTTTLSSSCGRSLGGNRSGSNPVSCTFQPLCPHHAGASNLLPALSSQHPEDKPPPPGLPGHQICSSVESPTPRNPTQIQLGTQCTPNTGSRFQVPGSNGTLRVQACASLKSQSAAQCTPNTPRAHQHGLESQPTL